MNAWNSFFRSPAATSRDRARSSRRSLSRRPRRLESLESRRLMAGDVAAYLDGSTLRIEGDADANHIEIRQLSDGSISIENTEAYDPRVTPGRWTRDGYVYSNSYYTLINGEHSAVLPGAFQHIAISMASGDDSVRIADVDVPWDLTIHLGQGADDLDVHRVEIGDDLRVFTEGAASGRDVVDLYQVETGVASANSDLVVTGTSDLETVYVRDSIVGDDLYLTLTQAGESDRAFVYNGVNVQGRTSGATARIDADYLYMNSLDVAGSGDFRRVQTLNAYDSVFSGNLWVDGTSGDDQFTLSGLTVAGQADVDAFAGDDEVSVLGGQAFDIDGGDDNDTLRGGSGNDVLRGGSGDDTLYGNAGVDQLFGGPDNDWLEAGSAAELAVGDAGQDWNAHRFDNGGATFDDIHQTQTPTCVLLSSLSAVAHRNGSQFLLNKIEYLGDFQYRVDLFNANGTFSPQVVEFDGTLFAWEPTIDAEGESWVILFQRAYLQLKGLDYTVQAQATGNAAGETISSAGQALTMLTGNASSLYFTADNWVNPSAIQNAVQQGKRVLVGTKGAGQVKEQLVNNHAYTVVGEDLSYNIWTGVWSGTVTLRNPWGFDGAQATGNTTDGLITIGIQELWSSIAVVAEN